MNATEAAIPAIPRPSMTIGSSSISRRASRMRPYVVNAPAALAAKNMADTMMNWKALSMDLNYTASQIIDFDADGA